MTTNSSPSTPAPASVSPSTAHTPSALEKRFARIQDDIAKEIADRERALARAHYQVGKILMNDPAMRAQVAALLEAHLSKMVPGARKPFDNYIHNRAEIDRLRKLSA